MKIEYKVNSGGHIHFYMWDESENLTTATVQVGKKDMLVEVAGQELADKLEAEHWTQELIDAYEEQERQFFNDI
tara:strand:- start:406 stop:627 length:222 start_codon:yes stop_codon:yes gene_type:complete